MKAAKERAAFNLLRKLRKQCGVKVIDANWSRFDRTRRRLKIAQDSQGKLAQKNPNLCASLDALTAENADLRASLSASTEKST